MTMLQKRSGEAGEHKMNPAELYREEIITDRRAGSIRRLAPVKPDGSPDPARKTLFVGEAQLLTAAGALPLSFELKAATLEDAVAKYEGAVQSAVEQAMDELRELRRRAASSIVIPEAGGGLGGALGPGGLPGGGKLKLS